MIKEADIISKLSSMQDRSRTLAEFICEVFKDKNIEVYVGDSYEEVSIDQISQSFPAVVSGKVIGAFKECLVLNCAHVVGKTLTNGNIIFINERAIRFLKGVDGISTLEDSFLRSKETIDLAKVK